jgi:HD-like signal output (HDOD) protein/DNA-binding response OmpR family regulator
MSTTILVVDDAPYIREPIAASLRLAGYETLCASNGAEGMALIASKQPALVLLDLEMPVVNGLDLLRRVGADVRPPVIMLTATQDRASVLAARDLGVRHFLLKSSFSLESLLARVRAVLAESPPLANGPTPGGDPSAAAAPVRATTPEHPQPTRQDASPAGSALMDREELMRRVKQGSQLKALSPAINEVMSLCDSASANTDSIAAAIKNDQVLSLKILKLANSSAYASGQKVTSVEQAVLRIGIGAIRQVVLNVGVVDRFNGGPSSQAIEPLSFWEHCIACGVIAGEIERATGGDAPDAKFTMGLLHDIGRLVFIEQLGPIYSRVLAEAGRTGEALESVESRLLGANHADIAGIVLRAWNVPKSMVEPIVLHHGNGAAGELTRDAAIVQLANTLAHALVLGNSGNETLYPSIPLCRCLGINQETLDGVLAVAADRTRDIKLVLLSNAAHTQGKDPLQVLRGRLRQPVVPLFVSSEPGVDALRVACERITDSATATPNLGIMHVHQNDDAMALHERYTAAERAKKTARLPLVVLGPRGVELDMADRSAVRSVATPVCLGRLVDAMNEALSPK